MSDAQTLKIQTINVPKFASPNDIKQYYYLRKREKKELVALIPPSPFKKVLEEL